MNLSKETRIFLAVLLAVVTALLVLTFVTAKSGGEPMAPGSDNFTNSSTRIY